KNDTSLARAIAVGFPSKHPNRDYVKEVSIPKYFIQSTNDVYGPRGDFQAFFDALPKPKQLVWVEASDHFFKDSLVAYESAADAVGGMIYNPVNDAMFTGINAAMKPSAIRLALLLLGASTVFAEDLKKPDVPSELLPNENEQLVLMAHGKGDQIYVCKANVNGAQFGYTL